MQTPFPILKRILEPAPVPQGMARSSTLQETTTCTARHNWVVAGTGLTGSVAEYNLRSHPSICCPHPFNTHHPPSDLEKDNKVWSTDGLQMDQLTGKREGRAALRPLSDGTSKTHETEGSAQLTELQAVVLGAKWGASTIYTDSCAVRAGATQWLPCWKAEGWKIKDKKIIKENKSVEKKT